MKNLIKKWLGIAEIEDVLTDPKRGYIGSEIDHATGLAEDAMKEAKEKGFKNFVECHKCGVLLRMLHAKQLPVFQKDVQKSDTLTSYHLFFSGKMLGQDSEYKEPTQTVFFCTRCKPVIEAKD